MCISYIFCGTAVTAVCARQVRGKHQGAVNKAALFTGVCGMEHIWREKEKVALVFYHQGETVRIEPWEKILSGCVPPCFLNSPEMTGH